MNAIICTVIALVCGICVQSLNPISVVKCGLVVEQQYSFDAAGTTGAQSNVWFQNGFVMSTKRPIFCGITVPVSGSINLNNSSYPLQLQNTLTLGNNAQLVNGGIIEGAGKYSVFLSDDLLYSGACLTLKNVTIESSNRVLTLASSVQFIVPEGVFLEFKNITVIMQPGARIQMQGKTSRLLLSNVRVIFEDDYRFDQGSLEVQGDTYFEGNAAHSIVYVSDGTLCIKSLSTLSLGRDMTLRYECKTSDRLLFTDRTSVLCFKESFLVVANTMLRLAKGTILVRRSGVFCVEGALSKIICNEGSDSNALFFERKPNLVRGDQYGGITYAQWDS
ncbi:MAG: hypothetical protein WCJ17_02585 [bacterium]